MESSIAPSSAPSPADDSATARGSTMKAIIHERYGRPDVLELREVDKPVIEDDQVLVRVHARAWW